MTTFVALFLTIPISFAASTILVAITSRSLRATLEETTDNSRSVAYWVPYSIAMLYLVPLFIGLLFGVATIPKDGVYPAAGMTGIFASVLAGCLIALAGIGVQLSKHIRRSALQRFTGNERKRWRDD